MKKTVAVITAACALAGQSAKASDALWDVFQNPPNEARASCYWWWKGDLTAPEMGRQLRLLKDAGLGGAHIIPWGGGTPAYLTPEWLALLGTTADSAKQEGMILDMSANAMWPFRGTWVSQEDSLHKVDVETYPIEGPQKFSIPAEKNEGTARILMAQLAPDPVSSMDQIQDVTDGLTSPDSPGVDVPAGKHTIYVVWQLSSVKTQPDFGRVPDHFKPAAMENYLKGFADRVAPALGGSLSNGLRALYCDSLELDEANWTPNFPEEFKRRCGYDLPPYLPLLLNIDDSRKQPGFRDSPLDKTLVKVRYDYCRTLSDLFLEGFARPFYRWCHENGVLCRMQLYGWPWFYNIDDGYRIPDMPEGNNWLFPGSVFSDDHDIQGWPIWQKYTSSGAHQAGRRIASTEAMTVVDGKYKETLDLVKRADDFNFVCGINHSFLHGFCYSSANEPFPGRNQYGTYFSEQNTWWPYMRQWMDYNARLNAVFQSSKPVAQVALLFRTSDVWGQAGLDRGPFQTDPPWAHQVWRWINQNGANADYVSDQILQQAAFDEGKIAFGPMHYDALIVLGAKTLVPATAEALERYAQAGGKIVFAGDIPESSPGLQDAPANDAKVRTIVQNLLLNYPASVIRRTPPAAEAPSLTEWRKSASAGQCLAWSDQLLTDLKIQRSVQFEKQPEGLYQIHYRSDDGRDLYFFANTAQSTVAARAIFPAAGKHLEHWNPETGTRSEFPVDKAGRALIALPPAGSLLLAAGAGEALIAEDLPVPPALTAIQEITGPWSVSYKPADGAAFEMELFRLAGLHESGDARLNRFAGQAVYKTDFVWDKSADKALHLDLGAVPNCITEVTLNGQPLGTRWYGHHDYVPDGAIKQGSNHLEVKVVTTLFNRLRKDTETAVPSGLIGPVVLSADPASAPYLWNINHLPFKETFEEMSAGDSVLVLGNTNGWYSGTNTTSTMVTNISYEWNQVLYPVEGEAHTKVLQYTDASLMARFRTNEPLANTTVDFMFSNSERGAPVPDMSLVAGVQMAFYLDKSGFLNVWHGLDNTGTNNAWLTYVNAPISTADWARVTVEVDCTTDVWNGYHCFRITLNGVELQPATNGYSKGVYQGAGIFNADPAGTWLLVASATQVQALTITGSGLLDDLVVTTNTVVGFFPPAYTLTGTAAGGNGTVSPASTNVTAGSNAMFVITASNYYRIASLATNGTSVILHFDNNSISTNFVWSNVQSTGALVATFMAQVATNPANTPYSWLAQYGLTNFNTDAMADVDHDGVLTWQEYIAGTNPTNSASVFKITGRSVTQQGTVIRWSSASDRFYNLSRTTNLLETFTVLVGASNLPATPPENIYTNSVQEADSSFYRINVHE